MEVRARAHHVRRAAKLRVPAARAGAREPGDSCWNSPSVRGRDRGDARASCAGSAVSFNTYGLPARREPARCARTCRSCRRRRPSGRVQRPGGLRPRAAVPRGWPRRPSEPIWATAGARLPSSRPPRCDHGAEELSDLGACDAGPPTSGRRCRSRSRPSRMRLAAGLPGRPETHARAAASPRAPSRKSSRRSWRRARHPLLRSRPTRGRGSNERISTTASSA
jgi:hypothetical protein